ncbi:MAG: hypothetical protein KJ601_00485 [Nanoarchaeota archaeon]|nr:hypothetical protein [Nanoarchaeota archaeon]MBU1704550.1 hypothetical protein [Nanoarchaeota archaeon]
MVKEIVKKIPHAAKAVHSEVKKNVLTAILAAFGFIIALVWRDFIKSGVDQIIYSIGVEGSGYVYQLIITFITTVFCVIGILVVSRMKGKEDVKD